MKVIVLIDGVNTEVEIASGGSSVPTFVASDSVFTVPQDSQVLFTEEINLDGDMDLDGVLVEVN